MDQTETPPARDPREIDWPLLHPLSAPVRAHDDTIQVLELRKPTGQDVMDFGLLEGLSPDQFFPLVTRLAGVPSSTLAKVDARDILSLATKLNRFFVWAALPPAS